MDDATSGLIFIHYSWFIIMIGQNEQVGKAGECRLSGLPIGTLLSLMKFELMIVFCKLYILVFNTSEHDQIEIEKRKYRACFSNSAFLACHFVHNPLHFDLKHVAI